MIWEPACGENHMVDVIRENGYKVIGTDILTGDDFLKAIHTIYQPLEKPERIGDIDHVFRAV